MSFVLWSGRAVGLRRTTFGFLVATACFATAYVLATGADGGVLRRVALAAPPFLAGCAVVVWSAALERLRVPAR